VRQVIALEPSTRPDPGQTAVGSGPGERFYEIIYWLMILVGVILIGEAAL
jgi:hypothetical protein